MKKIVANPRRDSASGTQLLPFAICYVRNFSQSAASNTGRDRGERLMAKALWGGKVIAESSDCVLVEGNQYFPATAVKKEYLKSSAHTSICPWKGTAHYYHVDVDGMRSENAAWFYPEPKPAANAITGRIAFWKGVHVEP
jgi:uncharacterized protein (DUF427 family)